MSDISISEKVDLLIAEKALGLEVDRGKSGDKTPYIIVARDHPYQFKSIPRYSASLDSAMAAASSLFGLLDFSLTFSKKSARALDPYLWRCHLKAHTYERDERCTYTKHWVGSGTADAAPMAVCLAVLDSKGIEVL